MYTYDLTVLSVKKNAHLYVSTAICIFSHGGKKAMSH